MQEHEQDLLAIVNEINKASTIVITAHRYPDGDAIGSSLAMYDALTTLGKKVIPVFPKHQIGASKILPNFDKITDVADFDFEAQPDLFIALDCAEPKRFCDSRFCKLLERCTTINIDHHYGNPLFGNFNYVIEDYSSTGELIYNLMKFANWEISLDAAQAIWVSLITDTNNFAKPSAKQSTFFCAADLLGLGVPASDLHDAIMHESVNVTNLRKRAYSSLEYWCNGQVAMIMVTKEDFRATQTQKKDIDEFPNIPLMIKGPTIAILIYPIMEEENTIRFSLRSKQGAKISAQEIAQHFGGAGHEDAAAAFFHGGAEEAKATLKRYLESVLLGIN